MAREKGMGSLQREKSGRWTMRVSIHGKRFSRSTRTKDRAQAERFLQRFLYPLGLGERRLPLADVWLEYVKSPNRNELANATLKAKQNVWMSFARWMEHSYLPVEDLASITSDMIAEYLVCIRAEVSANTYNNRVCVLREIFRTLAEKAGLEEDAWKGVRLRPDDSHSRRELTLDELHRLLEVAKKMGREWHTLFLIGIYTGLRLGDCCRLDWANINLAQGIIQIIPRKTRRHAHGRPVTIPIHPSLRMALLEHETSCGPVIPTLHSLHVGGSWKIGHGLSKIFSAAHIVTSVKIEGRRYKTPEATFHSLRHTFVSFAANAGVPLHIVQSIVGHESTAMTRHYYHENIVALQSAIASIPTL